MQWLIATDLDGTLLDDDYDLPAAAAAIDRQSARGHQVVLASSKTLVEMQELAGFCTRPPVLVFENGAGIAWPEQLSRPGDGGTLQCGFRVQVQGEGYQRLRAMIRGLRRRNGLRFVGFADMTAGEVAALTGLSEAAAARAKQRQATEPLRWLDSGETLATFRQALDARGYRLVEGGRFQHVMPRADKSCAVARIARRVAELHGARVRLLCCGDSANDLSMLRRADIAVIFPRPDGRSLDVAADADAADVPGPQIFHARAPGAGPWSRAVDDALRRVEAAPRPSPSGAQTS